MTLDEFKQSKSGVSLAVLLADGSTIARMEAFTREGKPAVRAIDDEVAARVGHLSQVERQHVGRWVRDVLGRRGLRPVKQLEWRGGKAFTSGAVYGPVAGGRPAVTELVPVPVVDRLAEARRLLAENRLDPSAPVDTVDAFIADRRRLWEKG